MCACRFYLSKLCFKFMSVFLGCVAVQLPDPYIYRRILLRMYGWSTAQLPQTQVYYDKLVLECQWRITVRFEARKDNNGYLTLKERVPQIIKNMLGPILDRLTTIFLHSEDEIHFLPHNTCSWINSNLSLLKTHAS